MKPLTLTINSYRTNFYVATVAALSITGLWFWLTWRWGFDLADEGYYWYGAQRLLRGEVPLRDFSSYDIGRYYWAAGFMHIMGDDGPFAARLSAAAYQVLGTLLGVFICLVALQREGSARWIFALLVAYSLTLWVRPYYKAYDHATSISIVAMLVLMLKTTKPSAWLLAGLCLGIAAIMGRNHGIYGSAAAILVISVLLINAPSRRAVVVLCGYFVLGVLIGFSPTLIMMLCIDGFMAAFVDSIVLIVKHGATNIALPVPWPWSVETGKVDFLVTAQNLAIGIGFVFLLAFPLIGILALAFSRFDLGSDARKVFVAATAAAIPYAHYAFSRSDVTHLSLAIFPSLIGLLAAGGAMKGLRPIGLAVGVLAVSFITAPPKVLHSLIKNDWVKANIAGEQLWIKPDLFERLQLINKELQELTSRSGKFLALPNMIGIHAIFRTQMTVFDIYPIIPRDRDFEAQEIRRLESSLPEIVLLSDHALDGNPELRYSRIHPLIYRWITSKYELTDSIEMHDINIYSLKRSGAVHSN